MIEKDRMIRVVNRDKGGVGYTIPDLGNLKRQFRHGEEKMISFEELEKLSWIPGGKYLLQNCLVIHDESAVRELLGNVEPEYYYGKAEIIKLFETGTLDQFMDCLEFAPKGVLDLIKDLAVSLPLNDVQKRRLIAQHLNFNVDNAIALIEAAGGDPTQSEAESRRRAKPISRSAAPKEAKPARRVETIKPEA